MTGRDLGWLWISTSLLRNVPKIYHGSLAVQVEYKLSYNWLKNILIVEPREWTIFNENFRGRDNRESWSAVHCARIGLVVTVEQHPAWHIWRVGVPKTKKTYLMKNKKCRKIWKRDGINSMVWKGDLFLRFQRLEMRCHYKERWKLLEFWFWLIEFPQ